jgi:tetratricopeptide (TPR) repeat protein
MDPNDIYADIQDKMKASLRKRIGEAMTADMPAAALELILRYRQVDPEEPNYRHFHGRMLYELARYEEARDVLLGVDGDALYSIALRANWEVQVAQVFVALGSFNDAEAWYHRAIATQPQHTRPRIFFGVFLRDRGRSQEALAIFQSATQLVEGDIDEACMNVGNVCRALGRYQDAALAYEAAIRLDEKYPNAKQKLDDVLLAARILAEPEKGKPEPQNGTALT